MAKVEVAKVEGCQNEQSKWKLRKWKVALAEDSQFLVHNNYVHEVYLHGPNGNFWLGLYEDC